MRTKPIGGWRNITLKGFLVIILLLLLFTPPTQALTTLYLRDNNASEPMPNVNQSSDFITHNYAASIASYSNPAQMNITAGAANTENSATLTEPKASHYTHLGSWVSDPLDGQSIDGTVTIALCLNESDAAVNMNPRVMIYRWITSDVKGENLLSLTTSGTEAPTSWPTSPSTYFSRVTESLLK
jgi:hypothetical protein